MAKELKNHNYNGIDATIIAHSKNEFGQEIVSYVCTFPRIILAELNTHRALSRNSASSRAIPFEKMVKKCEEHPFIPIAWQKDHKGMQGTEYIENVDRIKLLEQEWLEARNKAILSATRIAKGYVATDYPEEMEVIPVTKQLCNRLLEPFMWHTAIITATELENFFALRCPRYYYKPEDKYFRSKKEYSNYYFECFGTGIDIDSTLFWLQLNKGQGEIHIMALAEAMWDAKNESTPKELKAGEWHIPFGDNMDDVRLCDFIADTYSVTPMDFENYARLFNDTRVQIATARNARVSYMNFEGKDDYEADIKLHDNLAKMGHWSPFEHCAKVMNRDEYNSRLHIGNYGQHGWSGNFKGFIQYRKMFSNENITNG